MLSKFIAKLDGIYFTINRAQVNKNKKGSDTKSLPLIY